jgi:hypothetical protein
MSPGSTAGLEDKSSSSKPPLFLRSLSSPNPMTAKALHASNSFHSVRQDSNPEAPEPGLLKVAADSPEDIMSTSQKAAMTELADNPSESCILS